MTCQKDSPLKDFALIQYDLSVLENIWLPFLGVLLGEVWHLLCYFFEATYISVCIFLYKLFLQTVKSFPFLLKNKLILGISNICLIWYKDVKLMFWIFSFSVWVDRLHSIQNALNKELQQQQDLSCLKQRPSPPSFT